MLNDFIINYSWLTPILALIGVLLGWILYARSGEKEKLITWFLTGALVLELLSRYNMYDPGANNLRYLSISALFEYAFFSVFYYRYLLFPKRKWLLWGLAIFAVYLTLHLTLLPGVLETEKFQLYDRLLVDGVVLILSLIYFLDALKQEQATESGNTATNSFILVYVLLDLFMSLTVNFMVNVYTDLVLLLWLVRLLAIQGLYLNLSYKIWQSGKMQTP